MSFVDFFKRKNVEEKIKFREPDVDEDMPGEFVSNTFNEEELKKIEKAKILKERKKQEYEKKEILYEDYYEPLKKYFIQKIGDRLKFCNHDFTTYKSDDYIKLRVNGKVVITNDCGFIDEYGYSDKKPTYYRFFYTDVDGNYESFDIKTPNSLKLFIFD